MARASASGTTATPRGGVDTYVWEHRDNTYLIQLHFGNDGRVDYPGFVPVRVIRSFAPVAGAPPPTTIPAGPALVVVPDVTGMTEPDAEAALAAAGLDPRRVGQEPAPSPEFVGRVLRTDPPAGAQVAAGTLTPVFVGT